METYKYKAINQSGRSVRGVMVAANELDLEERLRVLGLDLIDARESSSSSFFTLSGSVTRKELILFCVHISQLEKAGVPILDALQDLRDSSETAAMKNLISEIIESVKGGAMLSTALGEHPRIFDEVFTGLVSAGEKTGNLHEIFEHLAAHLKWVHHIHSSIKKAIYYPAFLLFMMGGVIALMMLYVIPKLSNFLLSQNFELPIYTKALISTSDFFQNYWYTVIVVPVVCYATSASLSRMFYGYAFTMDTIKINLPVIGNIIRKIEMARFCRFLATTYKSGIGILDCLDIASNVIRNRVIKEAIVLARSNVSDGLSLTAALAAVHQFPNLVVRMIKVGEESGNLDGALEHVNYFYDREVDEAVNNLLAMIQPSLTVVMGFIMAWVSLSVFGPLYNSISKMKF